MFSLLNELLSAIPAADYRLLTLEVIHAVVQVFVSCHLDCCNTSCLSCRCPSQSVSVSIECGHSSAFQRLSSWWHLITPVLATLHWLPVHQPVTFKMAVLVRKCLHDVEPCYLVLTLVCAGCICNKSSSVTLCSVWGSPGALDPGHLLVRTALLCMASDSQYLEPITFSPLSSRIVIYIQAPA